MTIFSVQVHKKSSDLRKLVATWFAYIVLYHKRYNIKHDSDPPWDISGQAQLIGIFELKDLNQLEDLLQEPTGNTRASYISGCGLFHNTFEDDLREIIQEHVYTIARETGASDDFEEWSDELYYEAEELIDSLITECGVWSCEELFKEGELSARELKAEQYAEQLEQQARVRAGQMLIQRLGIESKNTICKKTPQWSQLRPILAKLSENERMLVSLALNVSNSIRQALSQGDLPE